MRRPDRTAQDHTSALLLTSLVTSVVAAVVAFALGALAAGLLAVAAGLVTLALAARRARPGNWPPADTDHPDQGR